MSDLYFWVRVKNRDGSWSEWMPAHMYDLMGSRMYALPGSDEDANERDIILGPEIQLPDDLK